jgi:lipopolysaccharide/colanic/teichoic acid biosynthesis glycosyltransferase
MLRDIATLALLSFALGIISGDVLRTAIIAAGGSAFLVLSFWATGVYRGVYVARPYDEVYCVVAAGAIALVPCVVLGAVIRAHHDMLLVCAAVALGIVVCSVVHVRFHHPGDAAPSPSLEARLAVDSPAARLRKRSFDLIGALLICLPVACVCAVIALVILIDDGGPVLFVQDRLGRDGTAFRIFKFRTMRRAAGDAWAVRGDPRITRNGRLLRRWSLDELPQLINVFRGEMSLVGPRPEMVSYAAEFARTLPGYAQRSRVKPGITGWAQVTLSRNLQLDDMPAVLAADLFYVSRWSMFFDLVIVLKTAAEVLFHRAV